MRGTLLTEHNISNPDGTRIILRCQLFLWAVSGVHEMSRHGLFCSLYTDRGSHDLA